VPCNFKENRNAIIIKEPICTHIYILLHLVKKEGSVSYNVLQNHHLELPTPCFWCQHVQSEQQAVGCCSCLLCGMECFRRLEYSQTTWNVCSETAFSWKICQFCMNWWKAICFFRIILRLRILVWERFFLLQYIFCCETFHKNNVKFNNFKLNS
jgi:hypothetical protein